MLYNRYILKTQHILLKKHGKSNVCNFSFRYVLLANSSILLDEHHIDQHDEECSVSDFNLTICCVL